LTVDLWLNSRRTMIEIIPSISILNGKFVRLQKGDFSSEKIYKESPLDTAKRFEDHGIRIIHLVDLDGAKRGSPVNYHILETIAGYTNLRINFSGGIATDGDISKAYEYGATSITAATVAVNKPDYFASWIISYGRNKIVLGADALDGKIAIRGWQKGTQIDISDHIENFYMRSLKYVKTTDISKDGLMEGPAFEMYDTLIKKFPGLCILASGGVRSVEDIKKLNDQGVYGVIFGKALYEDKIAIKDLEYFTSRYTTSEP
jgi:phosphoribosylformimino-5-aminoimidazole carboxamide ribotide isomerase